MRIVSPETSRWLLIGLAGLFLLLPLQGSCEEPLDDSAASSAGADKKDLPLKVEGFSPDHLGGTWAMGFGFAYGGYAILARHWWDESLAFDWTLGGNLQPPPSPGTTGFVDDRWNLTLGFGTRQNLSRPVEDVFLQLITNLTFSASYVKQIDYTSNPVESAVNQAQALNLYFGPGVEAFLPFWKNLSFEASAGLNFTANWTQQSVTNNGFIPTPNYSTTNSFKWALGIGNNNTNFNILNAAFHFYF
jgi:hypothetical protein